MDGWAGFSDEDLKRLKQPGSKSGAGTGSNPQNLRQKRVEVKPSPPPGKTISDRHFGSKTTVGPKTKECLAPEMRLSAPKAPIKVKEESKQKDGDEKAKENVFSSRTSKQKEKEKSPENMTKSKAATPGTSGYLSEEEIQMEAMGKEINEEEYLHRELSNLDQFRLQQKMIEEQNKRKKEILSTTIIHRQKKAKSEAGKLVRIQKELEDLDHLLQVDVSIVRNKIEDASREFFDAERRYIKAEKEFIESKTDLHDKSQLKEQLTEHLYTIIHQNEVRKAKKLVELMEKLDIEEDESEVNVPTSPPPVGLIFPQQSVSPNTLPTKLPKSPSKEGDNKKGMDESDKSVGTEKGTEEVGCVVVGQPKAQEYKDIVNVTHDKNNEEDDKRPNAATSVIEGDKRPNATSVIEVKDDKTDNNQNMHKTDQESAITSKETTDPDPGLSSVNS